MVGFDIFTDSIQHNNQIVTNRVNRLFLLVIFLGEGSIFALFGLRAFVMIVHPDQVIYQVIELRTVIDTQSLSFVFAQLLMQN